LLELFWRADAGVPGKHQVVQLRTGGEQLLGEQVWA